MNVKVKLAEGAVLPTRGKPGDAGLDLTAIKMQLHGDGTLEYDTGVHVEIPPGFVGLVFPRSSISNTKMQLSNSVGVIDENYRGPIKFHFKPSTVGSGKYNVGDRVGQLIIMPYPQVELNVVEELSDTVRGEQGFGSSDKVEETTETKETT